MKFINDESVIGKWEFFTNLTDKQNYTKINKIEYNGKGFKEIYFLPYGEKYWIFEGWTKGLLFIHYGGDEPILKYKYEIKEYNHVKYLFIDIYDENFVCVLKKVSDKHYKLDEIGCRDNINIPFVSDLKIIGKWKSFAYVNNICDYKNDAADNLWLKSVHFYDNGTVDRIYDDEIWSDKWTNGYLLDQKKSVKCKYVIKENDGKELMFLEWKMGNYVYGGKKATYYVFKRA